MSDHELGNYWEHRDMLGNELEHGPRCFCDNCKKSRAVPAREPERCLICRAPSKKCICHPQGCRCSQCVRAPEAAPKPGWLKRQMEQIVDCHPDHVRELEARVSQLEQELAASKAVQVRLYDEAEKAEAERDTLAQEFEEYVEDKKRLARELDAAISGPENVAVQASLCDLIGPAEDLRRERDTLREVLRAVRNKIRAHLPVCHSYWDDVLESIDKLLAGAALAQGKDKHGN